MKNKKSKNAEDQKLMKYATKFLKNMGVIDSDGTMKVLPTIVVNYTENKKMVFRLPRIFDIEKYFGGMRPKLVVSQVFIADEEYLIDENQDLISKTLFDYLKGVLDWSTDINESIAIEFLLYYNLILNNNQ